MGIKRVSLNAETIRILVEAEMSKHSECRDCTQWLIESQAVDESGCNWRLGAGADSATSRCLDRIASYIAFLRANFNVHERPPA